MMTKPKHKMYDEVKTDSASATDNTNSEKRSITAQDYKEMLQKRLYKLESESMPAT